jgi:neutral ceramidase
MSSQFRAGVGRCDITPPVGIAHGNWSAQVHERAEGIDLPLYCTALAASDGDEEIILAEWELLYPPDGEWLRQVRDRITGLTGVPASHIRISSTHTHSGPSLKRPWFDAGSEMIEPYVASLTDKLASACWMAHRSLEPARVAGGKGSCAVNCNRRRPSQPGRPILAPDPSGYSDHEVGVIRIDRDGGAPLATLVNYAAHPTILAWDNRLISPDYPGSARRTVESIVGGACLFLQGAAGNQNTVRDYSCRVEDARWIGKQVGLEAARVAESIETRPTTLQITSHVESSWTMGVAERVPGAAPSHQVRCISRKVCLPVWRRERPTDAEVAHLEGLKRSLAQLRADGAPEADVREANRLARRATLDLRIADQRSGGGDLELEFQAMRLGPVALIGIPVEPFAEIGAAVKAQSPFGTTFYSGYTNGVHNYLPIRSAYEEGGYEVWMTPFAPEAAEMTIAKSLELLAELSVEP